MAHTQHFRDNLKGIVRNLFCTNDKIPLELSVLDITDLFVDSIVSRDLVSGNFFIAFHLNNFKRRSYFSKLLSFMQHDFYLASIDGIRFFDQKDFNHSTYIQYFEINTVACLYYLVSIL